MKKIVFALIALIATFSATAQSLTAQRGTVKDGYNFWFYNPDNGRGERPKPVVIFLHGASLCGNDLNRVKRYGTIDAIEKGRELDAYVIAPQNPGGSWKPAKINNILEWVEEHYNVDTDRVYVLGMSLGGYGTLDMAAAYPEKIAAAMAFCGGSTSKNYEGLSQVPLWIVHGTADSAVPVSASDKVVAGIRSTGDDSRLIYHRVPGMNHSKPARYFYLKESYEWLFSHSLKDRDRRVNKRTFSTDLLAGAYKDLGRNRKPSGKVTAPTTHYTGAGTAGDAEMQKNLTVTIPTDASERLATTRNIITPELKESYYRARTEKSAAEKASASKQGESKVKSDAPAKKAAPQKVTTSQNTPEKPWGNRRSLKSKKHNS